MPIDRTFAIALFVGALAMPAAGQITPAAPPPPPPPPLDGMMRSFYDSLLDHLTGDWRVTRTFRGRTMESLAHADWVLGHQFLEIQYDDLDAGGRPDSRPYEARVFIGYDNTSERYVVHWLDIFGGRFSETIGYGQRGGKNGIRLLFEYPDGPFTNTFVYDPAANSWTSTMLRKDANGDWVTFAVDIFRHR